MQNKSQSVVRSVVMEFVDTDKVVVRTKKGGSATFKLSPKLKEEDKNYFIGYVLNERPIKITFGYTAKGEIKARLPKKPTKVETLENLVEIL